MYYWKVKLLDINKELIVYADNSKECDLLIKAWIKKQNKNLSYKRGDSFCVKKNTPLDIVIKEKEHLEKWIKELE